MSVKSRIAATAVLTAAVAAVVYPTAGAFAVDKPDHDARPKTTTVRQVLLPDGSRARLTSGDGGTSVTVTTHGTRQRTIDATRPSADLERLHLRIIDGDGSRPTLRAQLDGSRLTHYYDFASGTLRHTPEAAATTTGRQVVTGTASNPATADAAPATVPVASPRTGQHTAPAAHRPPHDTSGNPVKRVVEAGQVIKASHDVGDAVTPALAGGVALLAVGGGAYGVRVALRRNGRAEG
ncbi:hypothetical protein [Streptomyces griseocarneus]|uniref:hypothetical protein n=1 Tax=Streptomyces griseocarneus TaxID=51201 RepID=UPI00167DD4FA|nr:hypothetical protein [Streptomyces griseocarneus]MBZ6471920.1 hypothetical protein [Streptomyces griseocarneus]GHG71555.1 hypothetical protein GCM10018779_46420 [Streptomyces griseocarneus]